MPVTISPRIDCEKYSPDEMRLTIGPRKGLSGSVERISWRCGRFGTSTPTIFAMVGDQAPAGIDEALGAQVAA